ncbi:hypothetical protein GC197_10565 [bacterium]|nr:hypothetical protein [bacterium]
MRFFVLLLAGGIGLGLASSAKADRPGYIESFFIEGKYVEGTRAMEDRIHIRGNDAEASYALGMMQFLQAFELLNQNMYRHGLQAPNGQFALVQLVTGPLPGVSVQRLPVAHNPQAQPITYDRWRMILEQFVRDMKTVEETLSQHQQHPTLNLPVWQIRLDLDGDGITKPDETFARLYFQFFAGMRPQQIPKPTPEMEGFTIQFDQTDVYWLIAYTHTIRSALQLYLAYDSQELFDSIAHHVFSGNPTPPQFDRKVLSFPQTGGLGNADIFADLILVVHQMRFRLIDPDRTKAARVHLLTAIKHSRLMWDAAERETDDRNEWIPNARQRQVTGLNVTDERIKAWRLFLDEAEEVLEGKKLVSHWRSADGRGINIKRVLTEPRDFDLLAWVHGAAAVPYLESGPIVTPERQREILQPFGGNFGTFGAFSFRVN